MFDDNKEKHPNTELLYIFRRLELRMQQHAPETGHAIFFKDRAADVSPHCYKIGEINRSFTTFKAPLAERWELVELMSFLREGYKNFDYDDLESYEDYHIEFPQHYIRLLKGLSGECLAGIWHLETMDDEHHNNKAVDFVRKFLIDREEFEALPPRHFTLEEMLNQANIVQYNEPV